MSTEFVIAALVAVVLFAALLIFWASRDDNTPPSKDRKPKAKHRKTGGE